MKLISVVLPTYNRLKYLPRAVQSVLEQSYPYWELIIVDDQSTDNTLHWLKELHKNSPFSNKIKILQTPQNKGVSAARNLGVNNAEAEWVCFLDSDDKWLPHKLEVQISLQNNYKIIHGEEIWIRNNVRVNPMKKHKKSGGRLFSQCVPLCCISPSTVMLHKSLLHSLGGFREDYPVCEDYDLWLKICEKQDVGFISDPIIYKYGGHEDQLSHKFKAMDYWRIKSLRPYLDSLHISEYERSLVLKTLLKKIQILLKGYKKHNNMDNYNEILKIQEDLLSGS